MNDGILHTRRSDRKRANGLQAMLNDPRMREIAKQMGLNAKDLGADAQQMWQTLDSMATNDPDRYQSFIADQLSTGPPTMQGSNEQQGPKYITPNAGFVLKCLMYKTIKCERRQTKLFINCCGHEIVDAPKNPNSNREVPEDTRAVPSTNNLQIPLVVGKLKSIKDANGAPCCAIDVIFHPWVLRRSEWDATFKQEIMKLAIEWVQRDAQISLVSTLGKFIKSRYKGGVAFAGDIITSKFCVDPGQHETKTATINSPQDVLQQRVAEQESGDVDDEEVLHTNFPTKASTFSSQVIIPGMTSTSTEKENDEQPSKSKKKLIEVIGEETTKLNAKDADVAMKTSKSKATPSKKQQAVKRGFLNKSTSKLYPTGSSEGHKASSFVRLMDRSKVIDMNDPATKSSSVKFPVPASNHANNDERDGGDFEFDQLCSLVDPEYQVGDKSTSNEDPMKEVFGDNLDQLSSFLKF